MIAFEMIGWKSRHVACRGHRDVSTPVRAGKCHPKNLSPYRWFNVGRCMQGTEMNGDPNDDEYPTIHRIATWLDRDTVSGHEREGPRPVGWGITSGCPSGRRPFRCLHVELLNQFLQACSHSVEDTQAVLWVVYLHFVSCHVEDCRCPMPPVNVDRYGDELVTCLERTKPSRRSACIIDVGRVDDEKFKRIRDEQRHPTVNGFVVEPLSLVESTWTHFARVDRCKSCLS